MIRNVLCCALILAFSGTVAADITQKDSSSRQFKVGDKSVDAPRPDATGSQALTDASSLEYFINTDITFSTSSSASGAASEASYYSSVAADTAMGGTMPAALSDGFDGYNTLCVSFDGATGPCDTGSGGKRGPGTFIFYNDNGAATLDTACSNRQVIYPVQAIGGLAVERRVFVPTNDEFARWTNTFTNTTGAAITFNMITGNNLGSDSGTTIVTSSSGDAAVTTADQWVTTFQNFSGNESSDPRLGHVFGQAGALEQIAGVSFANGDDNPFWHYNLTLQPGQTQSIVNFATGQPTRADAAAKAAQLTSLAGTAASCMSAQELAQTVNYTVSAGGQDTPVPFADRRVILAVGGMLLLVGFAVLRRQSA